MSGLCEIPFGQRARADAFDVILLDVMLPKKDGFDVCRELRRSGVDSRILLLTARTTDSEKVLRLDLGADDYVTKPYSPKELRARIRALLRRPGASPSGAEVTRFGDCELDHGRGELRRAGRPVPTTPLELKLLSFLAGRAGRVLTRRMLIDEVWGHDTAITERVVDNQIASLRTKIEATPGTPRTGGACSSSRLTAASTESSSSRPRGRMGSATSEALLGPAIAGR